MKGQENASSESVEVTKTKCIAFNNFDIVITSFSETVRVRADEGNKNGVKHVFLRTDCIFHFGNVKNLSLFESSNLKRLEHLEDHVFRR